MVAVTVGGAQAPDLAAALPLPATTWTGDGLLAAQISAATEREANRLIEHNRPPCAFAGVAGIE
jgi:hypothetical protein